MYLFLSATMVLFVCSAGAMETLEWASAIPSTWHVFSIRHDVTGTHRDSGRVV